MSPQLKRYHSMTPEEKQHRKNVAAAWFARQDPAKIKAVRDAWVRRKLDADPDYFRRKHAEWYRLRRAKIQQKQLSSIDNGVRSNSPTTTADSAETPTPTQAATKREAKV